MKVLMFLSNPFINDARVYNEARSLIRAGHEVTVMAHNVRRQHPPKENWDGIEVARVPSLAMPGRGFGGPLWRGLNLILWQWRAYRRALELNRHSGFDVIHCHDLDTLLIGVGLKRRLGLPLIYDAHEIYGHMVARDLPRWVANRFLWLERRLLGRVDHVICVVEPQRRYFAGVTDKPITMVMNCKPLQGVEYWPPDNGSLTLLYVGVLQKGRGVPMLVDAVRDLPGVRCIIGGRGLPGYVRHLEEQCSEVPNADFIGLVPMDQVIPMTSKADVVFMMVDPKDLNNRMGLANKQFEAMVCGRPIICTRGTYSGELTEQEEVGLTAEYDKEALKEAIVRLRDAPELRERLGRNALRSAITKYNWQRQEEALLGVYESIREGSG